MRSNLRNLEQECQHLLGFLSTLQEAPSGIACIGGKPDMLIRTTSGIVGVEHTRLFHSTGEVSLTQDSLQDQIAREAWDLHRIRGGPARLVHIYFRGGRLTKRDIYPYAERIQQFVMNLPLRPRESQLVEAWAANRLSPDALPPQVDALWIDAIDNEESLWGVAKGGPVPKLTRELLEARIRAKEPLIAEYRKECSSVWLLLVADGFTPSTHFIISPTLREQAFQTGFNRLFVFHYFNRNLLELQTIKGDQPDAK